MLQCYNQKHFLENKAYICSSGLSGLKYSFGISKTSEERRTTFLPVNSYLVCQILFGHYFNCILACMQDDHSSLPACFVSLTDCLINLLIIKLFNDWFDIHNQTGIIYNISSCCKISCSIIFCIHVVTFRYD